MNRRLALGLVALLATTATAVAAPAVSFPTLDHAAQARRAANLAHEIDARLVDVDWSGMIRHAEVPVAATVTDRDTSAVLLALVRAHPEAFGVRDPAQAHVVELYHSLFIGEGRRWTGQLQARLQDHALWIDGHLWPVETPAIAVDRAKVLAPYLGIAVTMPSRCKCRSTYTLTTVPESFELVAGVAMVCRDGRVEATPVIWVHRMFNGGTPTLDALPELVDPSTRAPVHGDFDLPAAGELGERGPELRNTTGYNGSHGCFPRA
jgi:hypothetical protein